MATFNGGAGNDTLPGGLLALTGGLGADDLHGFGGDDTLVGGLSNDLLEGGTGADTLIGGTINALGVIQIDLLEVNEATYLNSTAGVNVDLSVTTAGLSVNIGIVAVNLGAAVVGAGGEADGDRLVNIRNLTGSGFNDVLGGDALENALAGLAGNDRLAGNGGNDTLGGGDGNDVLIGGSGADILSGGLSDAGVGDTASYRGSTAVQVDLGANTATGGDAAGDTFNSIENLFGSVGADTLTGNAGRNVINDGGFGGAGQVNTLTGGAGTDIYLVYNSADVIVEVAGEGADRVGAGVDYVLASGVDIEFLNTSNLHATHAINLTGNEIIQTMTGNDGDNVLDGGAGNDNLTGMLGADTFAFSTALSATGNVDQITDFSVADDQIQLDHTIFSVLGVGALDASAFKDNGTGVRDADDHIIYNSVTGSLFYDVDGVGGAAAVKFAVLTAGLSLSAADFTII